MRMSRKNTELCRDLLEYSTISKAVQQLIWLCKHVCSKLVHVFMCVATLQCTRLIGVFMIAKRCFLVRMRNFMTGRGCGRWFCVCLLRGCGLRDVFDKRCCEALCTYLEGETTWRLKQRRPSRSKASHQPSPLKGLLREWVSRRSWPSFAAASDRLVSQHKKCNVTIKKGKTIKMM